MTNTNDPTASLPSDDEVGQLCERLEKRAATMNGTLVGASDVGIYALRYYDQFATADDKAAAALIQSQAAALAAAWAEFGDVLRDRPLAAHIKAALDELAQIAADERARAERAEAALAEANKALDIAERAIEAHYDPIYQSESDDKSDLLELIRAARRAHSKDGGEHV